MIESSRSVARIGRATDNDVVLDAPGVSRYHATLTYADGAEPVLADLGSTNGTFVNGEPVEEPRPVGPDDLVYLGGFVLRVDGRRVASLDLSASRISALDITKEIGGKTIIRDISLAIAPREFVGLMGPSGSGKTTLMDALNGLRPATRGAVYVNELNLYEQFDALRRSIGHVPQRDVLHDPLSVERTVYFAARLRLPRSTGSERLRSIVDEVIASVGLEEQRAVAFQNLSGGQQKRLSLAVELVTKPSFIFLDEPTSPLDPEAAETMMLLFRELADAGRIVVMVTHRFEQFHAMNQVAILTRGGQLAFYGPPQEALDYFGARDPGGIYRAITARDVGEVAREFRASPQYRRYVRDRVAEIEEIARLDPHMGLRAAGQTHAVERHAGLAQWATLTRRYLEVKLKDSRNTAILLLQSPLIAALLAVITGDLVNDAKTLFVASIISIWFGANNAMREVVAESPIYRRERLVNLKIPSYVLSKLVVLGGIAAVQTVLFVAVLVGFGRLLAEDAAVLTLLLYLTSLGGVAMGLFFSALVSTTEKAISLLPLLLIPQLLLSGFLKPLDDVYVNLRTGKPTTAAAYERYQAAQGLAGAPAEPPPDPVSREEGMGWARYASAPTIARWSLEGLAHAVSVHDTAARDAIPNHMTIAEYHSVLEGAPEEEIERCYRSRVWRDCGILAGFVALFPLLTMWALKRKDVL